MTKLLAIFIFGICLIGINKKSSYQVYNESNLVLLSPPDDLKRFVFGYGENVADCLWIRLIQDFDICEQRNSPVLPVFQNDFPKKANEKMSEGSAENVESKCNNGWVFRMLQGITELAPFFRAPYFHGGIVLSVLVDDRAGATAIFEKGLTRIKDDWTFDYRAAYHFMIEEKQTARAAQLLIGAGKKGAPVWVFALAARLMSKDGQLALARSVLEEQIRSQSDENVREMFRKKLAEIESANSLAH